MSWFRETFGFDENECDDVRSQFELINDTTHETTLICKPNGRHFKIGLFQHLSLQQLRLLFQHTLTAFHSSSSSSSSSSSMSSSSSSSPSSSSSSSSSLSLGGLRFSHMEGEARELHLSAENSDAVFQVASQFNCLEMIGPHVTPDHGITRYIFDRTQGPACALCCPAATVYRNYFVPVNTPPSLSSSNSTSSSSSSSSSSGGETKSMSDKQVGQTAGRQLNLLSGVEQLLNNADHDYFKMTNGYVMPSNSSSFPTLNERLVINESKDDADTITAKRALCERIIESIEVGIHWSTSVEPPSHRVTQVFCSAVPVNYTRNTTKPKQWAPFACLCLDALYEATLLVAAILALQSRKRVKLFLTAVGGSAFGNPTGWIIAAIEKQLEKYKLVAPIDVFLVHFGYVSREFDGLKPRNHLHPSSSSPESNSSSSRSSDTADKQGN